MERPEYGYATYFFELVDSLPINWQIKRLVISMKLTSCSRISLLENTPLLVTTLVIVLHFLIYILLLIITSEGKKIIEERNNINRPPKPTCQNKASVWV